MTDEAPTTVERRRYRFSLPSQESTAEAFAFGNPGKLTLVALAVCLVLAIPTLFGSAEQLPYRLYVWGAKFNDDIAAGAWWRLLSSSFLHGSWEHLLFNAYALFVVGSIVEHAYGPFRFVVIFTVSAVAGSLLSYVFLDAMSVGASAAIFGLFGAALVTLVRSGQHAKEVLSQGNLVALGLWAAYSLVMGFIDPAVDNAGHIGGLLGGTAVAMTLPPGNLARLLALGCGAVLLWSAKGVAGSVPQLPRFVALAQGDAAAAHGDDSAADAAYSRALPLPEARLNRAVLHSRMGHDAMALADLDTLLSADPTGEVRALAQLNRATVLASLHRFEEALAATDEAVVSEDADTRQRGYFVRGLLLAGLGRLDEAAVALGRVGEADDPEITRDAHAERARTLLRLGKPDEASQAWQAAYAKSDNEGLEGALEAARAVAADPRRRDADALGTLAIALLALEQRSEAVAVLREAARLDSTYREGLASLRSGR
jgi:membrane associated rhomboid family serine protease/tetratricopeptide (TPR) repeat protein